MNLALVGTGSIAREHALAIATVGEDSSAGRPRLRAVVGRLAEPTAAFARELDIPLAGTDLDAVLADPAIDAVVVCSPSEHHADQTERALRAGKHVLCEIPLALSLPDVDRLTALAAAAGRRLGVCHTQRYHPALQEARHRVERGALHPTAVIARYGFLRRENVNWQGRRRSWTDNLLWHHGAHAVDTALWLLDASVAAVTAQVAPSSGALGIPMEIGITIRTTADQIATVALSYNTHLPIQDYLLIGDETTLLFDHGTLRGPDGDLVAGGDTASRDAIIHQDADFLAAVGEDREPPISGRTVRPAMAVLQAAQDALDADSSPPARSTAADDGS